MVGFRGWVARRMKRWRGVLRDREEFKGKVELEKLYGVENKNVGF